MEKIKMITPLVEMDGDEMQTLLQSGERLLQTERSGRGDSLLSSRVAPGTRR